ncbi:MAG TPA: hypothetical protein DDW50_02645 [Firmicutes bacterium]|jgi:uncharacterized protein|nr:hypothetical protein [Bacillota bacterium]
MAVYKKLLIKWDIYNNKTCQDRQSFNQPDLATAELFIKKIVKSMFSFIDFTFDLRTVLLLNLNFFEKIIGFQKQYLYEKEYTNTIQINSASINEEFISFAKTNQFGLAISIDGVFQKELKSQDLILEKLRMLNKEEVKYELITTFNDAMIQDTGEVYRFFKSLDGLTGVDLLIPDIFEQSPMNGGGLSRTINGLFDYWFNDIDCNFDIKILTSFVLSLLGLQQPKCIFKECCMSESNALVIDLAGSVYPCERRAMKAYLLGNIATDEIDQFMVNNFTRQKHARIDSKVKQSCRFCRWYLSCYGGCPAQLNQMTRQNEFCDEMQAIFSHIHSVLQECGILDNDENILIKDDQTIANKELRNAIVGFYS